MAHTWIGNGTLIDGTGRPPVSGAGVLISDGRIKAVGRAADLALPDDDLITIDADGGFILPGLIDTHVHIMLEGFDITRRLTDPSSLAYFEAAGRLKRTLDAGITSVRDAGGADLGVKQAVERGLVAGPRLQISITVMTITGGHADMWFPSGVDLGLFRDFPGRPNGRCDGVPEVRKKVREILRAGADVIKICSTGGVLSPTDHPEFTQFSPEELAVIVQEATYRNGVKVMSHAQGAEGVKNAIRAGIHSIEHGIYLDDEAIELMLEHGTFLVPTLLAPLAVLEIGELGGSMPEWGIKKAREVIEIHSTSIARAHQAGVKIAMGTDAGVMPHGTNLRELGLMVNIGLSPMEAIVATTKTAAECLGWDHRLGTLEKGKVADLIITRHDPLANIRTLESPANIPLVMKGGVIVKDHLA